MNVSIIIPAYNEELVIARTLDALAHLRVEGEWEVLLVDNASTDRTREIAQSYMGKLPLRVIEEKRKGRGQARATGFSEAMGDILFSTDADTQPPVDWVEKMIAPFLDPKVVAATCPPVISDAGPMTNWLYNYFAPKYFTLHRRLFGHFPIVGFSFAVRHNIYEKAGGFNPTLNAEEDIDLGLRVAKFGKIAFVPDVRVVTSGRRWRRGALLGMVGYLWTTVARLLGRHADLSDVR